MSDLLTPQAGADNADEQVSAAQETSEVVKLRQEAAKWRTQLREAQGQLKELQPLAEQFKTAQEAQKTEAQKAAERASAAEAKALEAEAKAVRAVREVAVIRLAAKAGVDPDLVPFLDLDKIDVEDEKKALEVLGKLAAARNPAGASNPARGSGSGPSQDELRAEYFGGAGRSKTTIFGGN